MRDPGFSIRPMARDEVDFGVELAAKEGWNPGLNDGEYFYWTNPDGLLIGLLDSRPVGCISAVCYNGVFGFIRLYVVILEYRGKGLVRRFGGERCNVLRATISIGRRCPAAAKLPKIRI